MPNGYNNVIPNTGTQISMGKVYYALGLTGTYPPVAGANVGLNSTLGANRGVNLSGQPNIGAGNQTAESSDFGGLLTPAYYPYYVYDAYVQVNSGGVCVDSGGIVTVTYDGPSLSSTLIYSEGVTTTVYRIVSTRYISDTAPSYEFSDPIQRAASYCNT